MEEGSIRWETEVVEGKRKYIVQEITLYTNATSNINWILHNNRNCFCY